MKYLHLSDQAKILEVNLKNYLENNERFGSFVLDPKMGPTHDRYPHRFGPYLSTAFITEAVGFYTTSSVPK